MERKKETTTTMLKQGKEPAWYIFDASGKTLGRFCSEIAKILRGKHKPTFTPHIDSGDGVIVINAEKIYVSGAKEAQILYHYYTGHIGGMRKIPYRNMIAKKPDYIIWHGVRGMMPKSRLGKKQMRKLRIFKGEEHGHIAQRPIKIEI
ncbi:MAG: 50S ribosomal protein L13 [Chlamydiales bacterium]